MENQDPNIPNDENNIFRSVKDIQKLKRDAQKLNEEASAYEFGFEKTSKSLVPGPVPTKMRRLNKKSTLVRSQMRVPLKDQFIETDNSSEKTSMLSNEPIFDGTSSENVTVNQNIAISTATSSNELVSSDPTFTIVSLENVLENVYGPISNPSMDSIIFDLDETQDDDRQLIEISETTIEGEERNEGESILFRKGLGFFEIVESTEKQITAKCLSCESSQSKKKINFKGIRGVSSNFLKHLKVII